MNKLGAQCQEKGTGIYQYNQQVLPNSVKAINVVDAEFWQRIWNENPRLKYAIYREYPNGQMPWDGNPPDIASAWVDLMERKIGHLIELGLLTHYEGYNEWVMSDQPYWFEAADEFMAALVEETHVRFGGKVHVIVGNFACGHFSDDIVSFPRTLAALNACGKCFLGTHEYDRDNMNRTSGNWLCGKWKRQDAAIKAAGYTNVGIAITEAGLDNLVQNPPGPQVGWRHYGATIEEAVAHLLNENNLAWYLPLVEADPVVKLVSWFGCSMYWDGSNWGDNGFDLANRDGSFPAGLLDGIKSLEGEEPPPPEPNGGDDMDIKVVDLEYKERDFKYAEDKYGVAFRRAEVEPGQKVWRLVELWEKTGNHSLITQTLGEDGQPLPNVPITFYWSGAPSPPDPPTTIYPHDWYDRFIWAKGNKNGEVGPGMGGGAWIDVDPNPPHNAIGGGPHAVWVHDPSVPSDVCEKLGMRGGTNHDHLDQKFKLKIEGEGPPPNGGDTVLKFKERLEFDHHTSALCIAYPADVAMNTRGDGRGPGVDIEIHPQEWEHPDGTKMALVELTADFVGDEPRTYTLRVYRMSDGASLTKVESEAFLPLGAPRKRVVYVYVESDGVPPEPPVDGDVADALWAIEARLGEIRDALRGGHTPPESPGPPADTPFHGEYFNNTTLSGVPVLRDDEAIDFEWGNDSPAPGVNADHFSVRWSAKKTFDDREYTFHALTDDGFRLWVDEALIIDAWKDQGPTPYQVTKTMTAGQHDIRVEYYENMGGATCKLTWS